MSHSDETTQGAMTDNPKGAICGDVSTVRTQRRDEEGKNGRLANDTSLPLVQVREECQLQRAAAQPVAAEGVQDDKEEKEATQEEGTKEGCTISAHSETSGHTVRPISRELSMRLAANPKVEAHELANKMCALRFPNERIHESRWNEALAWAESALSILRPFFTPVSPAPLEYVFVNRFDENWTLEHENYLLDQISARQHENNCEICNKRATPVSGNGPDLHKICHLLNNESKNVMGTSYEKWATGLQRAITLIECHIDGGYSYAKEVSSPAPPEIAPAKEKG